MQSHRARLGFDRQLRQQMVVNELDGIQKRNLVEAFLVLWRQIRRAVLNP